MFSSNEYTNKNERGEYMVAEGVSANVFRCILEYYKGNVMRCPSSISVQELREACDYLLVPFDAKTVKCQNLREYLMYFIKCLQFYLILFKCFRRIIA